MSRYVYVRHETGSEDVYPVGPDSTFTVDGQTVALAGVAAIGLADEIAHVEPAVDAPAVEETAAPFEPDPVPAEPEPEATPEPEPVAEPEPEPAAETPPEPPAKPKRVRKPRAPKT